METGQKRYELTNHLGNVMAAVSDKKVVDTAGTAISLPALATTRAALQAAYDYYPFGQPMPLRFVEDTATQYTAVTKSRVVHKAHAHTSVNHTATANVSSFQWTPATFTFGTSVTALNGAALMGGVGSSVRVQHDPGNTNFPGIGSPASCRIQFSSGASQLAFGQGKRVVARTRVLNESKDGAIVDVMLKQLVSGSTWQYLAGRRVYYGEEVTLEGTTIQGMALL